MGVTRLGVLCPGLPGDTWAVPLSLVGASAASRLTACLGPVKAELVLSVEKMLAYLQQHCHKRCCCLEPGTACVPEHEVCIPLARQQDVLLTGTKQRS